MAYCTKQNLIDRFNEAELIQLSDRLNTGSINDVVLNQAIDDATAEINSYLSAYPLPLLKIPANLQRLACDIARYYLYDDQAIDQVTKRYSDAIDYLKLIAKGTITLGPDVTGAVAEVSISTIAFNSSPSVFGR